MSGWLDLIKGSGRHQGRARPPAGKAQSLRSAIMDTPVPDTLFIPLRQHQGSAATPVVRPGDHVMKGQLLARAAQAGDLPVHASSSGRVIGVLDHPFPGEHAGVEPVVVIETDCEDRWLATRGTQDFASVPRERLLSILQEAGICGLGGAGFPTHVKLATSRQIDTLVINAVECEPYITADQALIRQFAPQVVAGAMILQRACQARRCLIATQADRTETLQALSAATAGTDIEILTVPVEYPAGSEKLLVRRLTGREIPAGQLPAHLGVLVVNAGTADAARQAVMEGRPLVSRITTLCGGALRTPKNFRVLIGTPVSYLLGLCGVDYGRLERVVVGGPMMGFTLHDLAAPVIKTTNCLVAGTAEDFPPLPLPLPCIRCAACHDACPVNLAPDQLYREIRAADPERAAGSGLDACIDCGACAYVCPSHIPLVAYFKHGKAALADIRASRDVGRARRERYEHRRLRLEREGGARRKAQRRSVAVPQIKDQEDPRLVEFSREQARREIAAAVARVRARKQAADTSGGDGNDEGK